nr:PREDICTED: WAP four-disulfide core domain protein 3-like [Anolis carolinensis]|eukprot:XP_016853596.1 PREDICTED: WAP four-disulfide core domain protein 3-like [Anolis carolinensis]
MENPVTAEVSHPCPEASPATTLKKCDDLCVNDTDCPTNTKCSPTDCGFQCKELPPASTAWPAAPRSRPAPISTSVQPLLTSPPPEAEQSGVCPVTFPKTLHLCRDWCRTDRDCPTRKKCCQNGCIRVCTEPLWVKPGACPLRLRGSMGPCPEPNLQNCSKDDDCAGAQKCCPIGCSSVCKEPEEVRPGSCPLVSTQSSKEPECPTLTFCIRDKDCSQKHMKCCWHTCGWVCLAATGKDQIEDEGGRE